MMKTTTKAVLTAMLAAFSMSSASHAADPACAPIIEAAEAHAKAERMRVRMQMNDPNRPDEIEAMIVPEGMYIKAGDQWIKSPIASTREQLMKLAEQSKGSITECKALGKETVDGVPTSIYKYKGKVEGQPDSDIKLWIANADGLPKKAEIKSEKGMITQFISHGADIQAPKGGLQIPAGIGEMLKGLMK